MGLVDLELINFLSYNKTMKFLGDIVIVRVNEKTISDGGIHIVDPVRATNIQQAVVLDIGSRCKLELMIDDIVLVSIYLGTPKEIDGLNVRVYDSCDILAKIVEE